MKKEMITIKKKVKGDKKDKEKIEKGEERKGEEEMGKRKKTIKKGMEGWEREDGSEEMEK